MKTEALLKPRIFMTPRLIGLINKFIMPVDHEVHWFSHVEELSKLTFLIDDILIPPQEVAATTVESDSENGSADLRILAREPHVDLNRMFCYSHSHVDMGVSPSGVDDDYLFKTAQESCPDGFYIGTIHNKRGESYAWMIDMRRNIWYKDIPIEVYHKVDEEDSKYIEEALKTKIRKKVVTLPPLGGRYPNQINFRYQEFKEAIKAFEKDYPVDFAEFLQESGFSKSTYGTFKDKNNKWVSFETVWNDLVIYYGSLANDVLWSITQDHWD